MGNTTVSAVDPITLLEKLNQAQKDAPQSGSTGELATQIFDLPPAAWNAAITQDPSRFLQAYNAVPLPQIEQQGGAVSYVQEAPYSALAFTFSSSISAAKGNQDFLPLMASTVSPSRLLADSTAIIQYSNGAGFLAKAAQTDPLYAGANALYLYDPNKGERTSEWMNLILTSIKPEHMMAQALRTDPLELAAKLFAIPNHLKGQTDEFFKASVQAHPEAFQAQREKMEAALRKGLGLKNEQEVPDLYKKLLQDGDQIAAAAIAAKKPNALAETGLPWRVDQDGSQHLHVLPEWLGNRDLATFLRDL